tara:strand:+ start:99 stop:2450 length:2352 start_codon:yes stop_codon:yes gene_type:complete
MAELKENMNQDEGLGAGELGALGLAALAVAHRVPIIRKGKQLYKGIRALTGKADDVAPPKKDSDIIEASNTVKENKAMLLRKEQEAEKIAKQKQDEITLFNKENHEFEKTRELVKKHPYTNGGSNLLEGADPSVNGSALFDAISLFPNIVAKRGYQAPAAAWSGYFKKGLKEPLQNYKTQKGQENLLKNHSNVELKLTRNELEDANIAYFDANNDLVGGYLRLAQDNNVPVAANTLLHLVKRNPALNTSIIEHGPTPRVNALAQDFFDQFDDIYSRLIRASEELPSKLTTMPIKQQLLNDITNHVNDAVSTYKRAKEGYQLRNMGATRPPDAAQDLDFVSDMADVLVSAKKLAPSFDDIGIPYNVVFGKLNKTAEDLFDILQNKQVAGLYAKNSQQEPYRFRGVEEYFEDVMYFKGGKTGAKKGENIFGDTKYGPPHQGTEAHYADEADNILYHVRYGTRSAKDNLNQKVYVVDEIQSDVQQQVAKNIKNTSKTTRMNPVNNEQLVPLFTDRRIQKFYEIEDVLQKGLLDERNMKAYQKLKNEYKHIERIQKDVTKGRGDARRVAFDYATKSNHFQPYYDNVNGQEWGAHAIRHLIQKATKHDVDFIAINPSEAVSWAKLDKKPGSLKFYGNHRGKMGYKGLEESGTNEKVDAVLPKVLKDLAKQYKTEAKTIEVAKSDPTKPYKVIRYTGDSTNRKIQYGDERFRWAEEEHMAAFKTEAEANQAFITLKNFSNPPYTVKKILADDPENYYKVFGLKVTPEMKKSPLKLYRSKGGLVVNIFKW